MSTHTPSRHARTLTLGEAEQIAHRFEAHIAETETAEPNPLAFFVERDPDGTLTFGVQSLHTDPASALVGLTAPPSWLALGIAASGHAHRTNPDVTPGYRMDTSCIVDPDSPGESVRLVMLVTHHGDAVALTRMADGELLTHRGNAADDSLGRIDDALRLALGLPTAVPPADSTEYHAALWLDRLLGAALHDPSWAWSWDMVAEHHPVFDGELGSGIVDTPKLHAWVCANLERAGSLMATRWTWNAMLAAERAGEDLHACDMAWLDEGAYSRTLLAQFPPVSVMLDDLDALLPLQVAARVRETVEAWLPT